MTVGEYLIYVTDYAIGLLENCDCRELSTENLRSFMYGNGSNKSGLIAFMEFVESNPFPFKLVKKSHHNEIFLRGNSSITTMVKNTVSFDSAMADFYAVNRAPQELIDLCDSYLAKNDNSAETGYTENFYSTVEEIAESKEEFDFDRSCL